VAGVAFSVCYVTAAILADSRAGATDAPRLPLLLALAAGVGLTAGLFSRSAALLFLLISLAAMIASGAAGGPAETSVALRLILYGAVSLAALGWAHNSRRHGRLTEERYKLLVESAFDGIVLTDRQGAVLWANARAAEIFGRSHSEMLETSLCDLIAGEEASGLCAALRSGNGVLRECRARGKDGAWLTVEVSARALSQGWFLSILRDVSERKRAEEKIRAALREKEILLGEIHHRVKNNLQMISSMLELQARRIGDPQALERFQDCLQRVRSIALLHETLYRCEDLARIDMGAYVRALVERLASAYRRQPDVQFRIEVEDVHLDLESAVPCSLILAELVSNALKHAFPDGEGGQIGVRVEARNGRVELAVADTGVGLPEGVDLRKPPSLGLELVSALARQLRAELRVSTGSGTCFTLTFTPKSRERQASDAAGKIARG